MFFCKKQLVLCVAAPAGVGEEKAPDFVSDHILSPLCLDDSPPGP
jgi:hypothetical protein